MKKFEEINADVIIKAACKFFPAQYDGAALGFAVTRAAVSSPAFVRCVNEYRRAYYAETLVTNEIENADLVLKALRESQNSLNRVLLEMVERLADYRVDVTAKVILENFFEKLCPDVYAEEPKQTLLD